MVTFVAVLMISLTKKITFMAFVFLAFISRKNPPTISNSKGIYYDSSIILIALVKQQIYYIK